MLYQGSQNETKRTKVATPTIRSLWVSSFRRCRDFRTGLGFGRAMTGGLIAAPHLGQTAVPKGTSIRQREHAGTLPTSFLPSRTRRFRLQAHGVRLVSLELSRTAQSPPVKSGTSILGRQRKRKKAGVGARPGLPAFSLRSSGDWGSGFSSDRQVGQLSPCPSELVVTPVVAPERPVESAACQAAVLESDDSIRMDMDLCVQASRINSLLP
jgi:hypothetical protein